MIRDDEYSPGRRRFLSQAGALSVAMGVTDAVAAPAAAPDAPQGVPRDVGRKFNADGSVHPFAGNTFVGHLGQQGEDFAYFDALLDIYRDLPRHAFTRKMAVLPPSSYHVTLFGGLNDIDRINGPWPADIPRDTRIEKANDMYLERLERLPRLVPEGAAPFDFVLDQLPKPSLDGAPNIPLRPADEATAARLQALRDRLSALTGLRRPDHDRYRYHMTIGYIFQYLTAEESSELRAAQGRWMERLAAMQRPLRIRRFDYCVFRDMYAFRVVRPI